MSDDRLCEGGDNEEDDNFQTAKFGAALIDTEPSQKKPLETDKIQ